jgi:hypothetical protein
MRGMGLAVVWREAQVFLSVFQCLFLCQDGLPFGFQFRVSHGASSLAARGERRCVAPRAARRPGGKARRPRIPAVFERGATPPPGMHRRPNAAGLSPRAAGASLTARMRSASAFRRSDAQRGPRGRLASGAGARVLRDSACSSARMTPARPQVRRPSGRESTAPTCALRSAGPPVGRRSRSRRSCHTASTCARQGSAR